MMSQSTQPKFIPEGNSWQPYWAGDHIGNIPNILKIIIIIITIIILM